MTISEVTATLTARLSGPDGIKLTITNIDTALGEENIRQMMFSKIGKVCELMSLEIKERVDQKTHLHVIWTLHNLLFSYNCELQLLAEIQL